MSLPSALFAPLALAASKTTLPAFIYGTAWKKDQTTDLVFAALSTGFRAIDTACQPRHYREDLVGEGVRKFLSSTSNTSKLTRADLYIQTKYTAPGGQDATNCPYDVNATLEDQVHTSVATSLRNFTISPTEQPYLDALVLHSPMETPAETLQVWRVLETYVPERIRHLGISNCTQFQLMDLYERASVKPVVVQNRFYDKTRYDIGLRRFCAERGILYQSFWTLTANPELLKSKAVKELAMASGVSVVNALYGLVLGLGGTTVLNGTKTHMHMKVDLDNLAKVREFAKREPGKWDDALVGFRKVIGEPI